MPSFLLKADPDKDLYCIWSTVVDAPTWVARGHEDVLNLPDVTPDRVDRADRTGTSEMTGDYGWGDEGFILSFGTPDGYQWWLPRPNLAAFLESYLNGEDDEARFGLLESLEDDEEQ